MSTNNKNDGELDQIAMDNAFKGYYKNRPKEGADSNKAPEHNYGNTENAEFSNLSKKMPEDFQAKISRETDPDLMISFEKVPLPSKGIFYKNEIDTVEIEYLTSRDEDLLTTPSLIEDGSLMDRLLERKIKTKGVNPKDLLNGDRNAIALFLRSSSYGSEYTVSVRDPRTGKEFEATVDLTKLKYKELKEYPDELMEYSVNIPMRKKKVKFRILTAGEEDAVFKKAEARKQAYGLESSEYQTMKLKASIVEINDNRDRDYINKFVDAMPALDALTIRRKIMEVQPDVDMNYEFTASDGYKFKAMLSVGVDFFFPEI